MKPNHEPDLGFDLPVPPSAPPRPPTSVPPLRSWGEEDAVFESLVEKQHRIVDVLARSYSVRVAPRLFSLSDCLSPRWVRLPFSLEKGETFERLEKQAKQLAQLLGRKLVNLELDEEGVWLSFPRRSPVTVHLREALREFRRPPHNWGLWVPLGVGMDNRPAFTNLADAPHLLIVGTSGSGKTVTQNALIASLAFFYGPHYLNLILCDGKGGKPNDGFDVFGSLREGRRLAHLSPYPVVIHEVEDMVRAIYSLIDLMEKRQSSHSPHPLYPYYVLVIDELADVLAVGGAAVENALVRLLMKSRSAGIHVVAASARADKATLGVLPGFFKKRMVLSTVRAADAYMATNSGGSNAQLLLMKGDMLFGSGNEFKHLQGYMVNDESARSVLEAKGRFVDLPQEVLANPEAPLMEREFSVSEGRSHGRPRVEPSVIEVDAVVNYKSSYGSFPSKRQLALGKITGSSMGMERASRILVAAEAAYMARVPVPSLAKEIAEEVKSEF